MTLEMLSMLLLFLFGPCAEAVVLTSSEPLTTPAPLEARAVTTVGYMSTGSASGTTLWAPITLNGENLIIATQGSIYRLCDPTVTCEFFTCSRSWAVFASGSISCGGSSLTCSSYVLASDISDRKPLTNYWCDDKTKTGGTIYRTTPNGKDVVTTSPNDDPGPTPSPSPTPTPIPSPSPNPPPPKPSTPVGAIVGGVIGGLAVLGAIIVAVVFLLRRKRNATHSAPAPVQYQQAPMAQQPMQPMQPQQQFYDPARQSYVQPEKMPGATSSEVNSYYMGPASPTSPAPQYSPAPPPVNLPPNVNELPSQRM